MSLGAPTPAPTPAPSRTPTWVAWAYLLLAGSTTVASLSAEREAVRTGSFLVVGVGCVACLFIGLRWHRPTPGLPWRLILAGSLLFLVAVLSRDLLAGTHALPGLLPDAFAVAGYVALSAALIGWLSASQVGRDGNALLDAGLVGSGVALVAWALLVAPALQTPGLPVLQRGLYALYPVLDAVLLTLTARLAFTQAARRPAFWLFAACIGLLFVGDVAQAFLAIGVPLWAAAFADAPYLLAYAAMSAAALHPSMARLGERDWVRVTGWSAGRLCLLSAALSASVLVPLVVPVVSATDRAVRAVLAAALVGGVLARAARAVNRHATSEAAARRQATHDQLTGLPNRVLLNEQLAAQVPAVVGSDERLSVLFLDLDGFKLINDSHGHELGDELLIAAAGRLQQVVRADDFVARLGGDEFVVVGRHDDLAGAEGLAARIVGAFAQPFRLNVGPVFVGASIGIAQTGGRYRGSDGHGLLRDADTAMYRAKAAGRSGYVIFDQSLRDTVRHRMDTETALRFALERDEFELHYQPIHDLAQAQTIGYEALLRWRHPQRGLLPPAEFLPLAEELGLIVPVGAWAIRQALEQLAVWHRATGNSGLHVTVNVSARQLRGPTLGPALVATVRDALADTGLPASALWLELTETAMIEDPAAAHGTLVELRDLGVLIAVDDFGTGYCALSYLKHLPVGAVKLDREFVAGLGQQDDDTAILRALVAVANALDLQVVAEGVETAAQEAALRKLGCVLVQGFRYGRPQPASMLNVPEGDTGRPLCHAPVAAAS